MRYLTISMNRLNRALPAIQIVIDHDRARKIIDSKRVDVVGYRLKIAA